MTRPVRPVRRAAPMAMLLALLLALTMSGCSGDDEPTASASSTPDTASPAKVHHVATTVTLGRLTGKIRPRNAKALKKRIGHVVDRWFDAAFVAGRYPRNDFHDAFPGFTSGARAEARHDRRLMSNQDIGRRISSVTDTQRRVRLDVLSVRRVAVALTARVVLEFRTDGKLHRRIRVAGRLYLTRDARQKSGWSVFGYDITKGGTR